MTKQFDGVKAEKAEAMRRYNNQKRFRNIVRAAAVAFFCYLWFPTVAVSLQAAGAVIVNNRAFVFFFANTLVALIFLLSRHDADEEESASVRSGAEPDLYDQYTSSFSFSAVTVTASDEKAVGCDDSKKQIVPAFIAEEEEVVAEKQIVPAFIAEEVEVVAEKQIVPAINEEEEVVVEAAKGTYRRTRSERKKKVKREVTELRRSESESSAIERLNSEEFRLKVEAFIMEKKRSLVLEENDVVGGLEHCSSGLELVADS